MKLRKNGIPSVERIAKIAHPLFKALMYLSFVCAAILIILAPIIFIVNLPPAEMILPPYMRSVTEGENLVRYDIFIGNGIRIEADAADVTLEDIKTVIYAGIFMGGGVLLVFASVCRFLSLLFFNLKHGLVLVRKNADYIRYIGLTILVGNTVVLFLNRFYNYLLVSTFLGGAGNVKLALNLDWSGILLGGLILLFGKIFGHACRIPGEDRAVIPYDAPPSDPV